MLSITRTNTLLLQGLADPRNHAIWSEFDQRYRPVVQAFARKLGLSAPEADEAAQDTLSDFAEQYRGGRYDRGRGRLRAWLFAIAKTRVARLQRARAQQRAQRGESALGVLPEDADPEAVWEAEWRRAVFQSALAELRTAESLDPTTLRAFERVALEGRDVRETAAELGVTPNAIYIAKHRCLERLRAFVAELEERF